MPKKIDLIFETVNMALISPFELQLKSGTRYGVRPPVLIPLADQLQLDLVHLGIFVIINGEVGLNTPPVGGALFTLVKVANISIEDLVKALIPFYFPLVVVLLLVTYFPDLVLFLPNLILK